MRNAQKIADEAIAATCGVIKHETILHAIEVSRTEALVETYLRKTPEVTRVYILTGTQWNDMVRYMRHVEGSRFDGFRCTNTAFNDWQREIKDADVVVLLKGWNDTKLGRNKHAFASHLNKHVITWQSSEFSKQTILE